MDPVVPPLFVPELPPLLDPEFVFPLFPPFDPPVPVPPLFDPVPEVSPLDPSRWLMFRFVFASVKFAWILIPDGIVKHVGATSVAGHFVFADGTQLT